MKSSFALLALLFLASSSIRAEPPLPPSEESLRASLNEILEAKTEQFKPLKDKQAGSSLSEDKSTMWTAATRHLVEGDDPYVNDSWIGDGASYLVIVGECPDRETADATAARWRELLQKALPLDFVELPVQAWTGHARDIFYGPGVYRTLVTLHTEATGESPFPPCYGKTPPAWRVGIRIGTVTDWERKLIANHDESPAQTGGDELNRLNTTKLTLGMLLKERTDGFPYRRAQEFGKDDSGAPEYLVKGTVYPGKPAPIERITLTADGVAIYSALFAGVAKIASIGVAYEDCLTPELRADGYALKKTGDDIEVTYVITKGDAIVSKCVVNKAAWTCSVVIAGVVNVPKGTTFLGLGK